MKYVISYGSRSSRLPADVTAEVVTTECRAAALAFMAGAAGGWGKEHLARWLIGPYANAVRHARHGERVTIPSGQGPVSAETITTLLRCVRTELLHELVEIVHGSTFAPALTQDAIELGVVRALRDESDSAVWVPVDSGRMRLAQRVRSLFAADCLNQPDAWETLFVCGRCSTVAFDAAGRRAGLCASHRRSSGVVTRPAHDEEAATSGSIDAARGGRRP
jgi:hypothetical protein